jgi:hypothetical protein
MHAAIPVPLKKPSGARRRSTNAGEEEDDFDKEEEFELAALLAKI